jgi:hypothetical protein
MNAGARVADRAWDVVIGLVLGHVRAIAFVNRLTDPEAET